MQVLFKIGIVRNVLLLLEPQSTVFSEMGHDTFRFANARAVWWYLVRGRLPKSYCVSACLPARDSH